MIINYYFNINKDISQSGALEVRLVYKMTGGWSEMS